MKEIVVVSGKGGTGKTTFTAALSSLVKNAVFADCDVDAADLHLIFSPEIIREEPFSGGKKADILESACTRCGKCIEVCVYNAISSEFKIDPMGCEGCGACHYFCPDSAIRFEPCQNGRLFVSKSRFGDFVHAELIPGEENSGKLVTKVRNEAKTIAINSDAETIIADGSPGVGCSVIASVTGADYIVIVTEPTISGLSDMKRVLDLLSHFRLNCGIVVNKSDINPALTAEIREVSALRQIDFLGTLPYDTETSMEAMVMKKNVIEAFPDSELSQKIISIGNRILMNCP